MATSTSRPVACRLRCASALSSPVRLCWWFFVGACPRRSRARPPAPRPNCPAAPQADLEILRVIRRARQQRDFPLGQLGRKRLQPDVRETFCTFVEFSVEIGQNKLILAASPRKWFVTFSRLLSNH